MENGDRFNLTKAGYTDELILQCFNPRSSSGVIFSGLLLLVGPGRQAVAFVRIACPR